MADITTRLIRGPQLLTSTVAALVKRDLRLSDLTRWIAWQRVRKRVPRISASNHDQADDTLLLTIADSTFWWPREFVADNLDLVWAEVFLPYPPNGHAYEHGPCRIKPGNCVIDAGACEGFFISYALRKGARVVAVEPVPRLAHCLKKTFEKDVHRGAVTIANALLGDSRTIGRIEVISSPIGAKRSIHGGELVVATTIDAMVQALAIATVDFIKMDIEGSETSALSGAQATLARCSPTLSLATYHDASDEERLRHALVVSGVDYHTYAKGLVRNKGRLVHQILHAWPRTS